MRIRDEILHICGMGKKSKKHIFLKIDSETDLLKVCAPEGESKMMDE